MLGGIALGSADRAQQILGVQHADDVFRLVAPQGNAGVFGRQHLAHQVLRRQVGVDHHHFGAVDHDVGDLQLAQVQQAAEHVAVLLFDLAFVVQQIDRAAQALGRRQDRLVGADLDAEHLHQHPDDRLDHGEQRPQQIDHQLHRARDQQRHPVRRVDGDGLRQHLGEDHDQHRHHAGGVEHADLAEPGGEDAGRERRGADIGDVVAEQQRADHPLAHRKQAGDDAGLAVALLRQPQHAGARGAGQRGLARREEGGDQETGDDDGEGNPVQVMSSQEQSSSFSPAWLSENREPATARRRLRSPRGRPPRAG